MIPGYKEAEFLKDISQTGSPGFPCCTKESRATAKKCYRLLNEKLDWDSNLAFNGLPDHLGGVAVSVFLDSGNREAIISISPDGKDVICSECIEFYYRPFPNERSLKKTISKLAHWLKTGNYDDELEVTK